jgi:predicted phage-related endonuclease
MSQDEIARTVRELQEFRRMQDDLEKLIEGAQDKIKAHMGDTEELIAGPFKVTWKPVSSARFNTAAFKIAAPEMYDRFTKSTTTRRFCVE